MLVTHIHVSINLLFARTARPIAAGDTPLAVGI